MVHIVTHMLAHALIPFLGFPHVPPPSDQWVATMNVTLTSCGIVDAYFIHDQNETIESNWFRMSPINGVIGSGRPESTEVMSIEKCRESKATFIRYDVLRETCTEVTSINGAINGVTPTSGIRVRRLSSVFEYTREYNVSERRAIVRRAIDACETNTRATPTHFPL